MAYAQEIIEKFSAQICERVAMGETIYKISQDNNFPSRDTMYSWIRRNPEFYDNYARARSIRAFSRSDRIDDYKEELLAGRITPEVARVLIDAEKWQAGKENPKVFGDKTQVDLNTTVDINALIIQAASERLSRQENTQVIENTPKKPESIEDLI